MMDVQTSVIGIDTLVGTAVSQTLIDSEIPLPDGRVAAAVLSAGAQLGACQAEAQKDVVRAGGSLTLQLLCQSPSGEVFGFSASSTYVHSMELPGAAEGMAASAGAQVLECGCTVDGAKLRLSAVLELSTAVVAPVADPFVTGIAGVTGLESRQQAVKTRRSALLATHSVRIREEISAPTAAQVLLYHGTAQVRELVYNGTALTVEGSLYATVLTASDEGQLTQQTQIIPFTEAFDAPYAETAWATATVEQVSAVAADMSFGVADVEALVQLRIYGLEAAEQQVLFDAYDENGAFACARSTFEQLLCTGAEQKRFPFREGVQIPSHLPDAYRMVYASAIAAMTGAYEAEGGRLGIDAMVFATVLYQCDGGQLHSFPYDLPLQLVMDAPYTPDARVELQVLSAQLTGSGRTPELLLTLEAQTVLYDRQSLCAVTAVQPDDAGEPAPARGIIIYCAGAGETLWDIGKRFRVTLGALAGWNADLPEAPDPAMPLQEGAHLVLLK